MPDSLLKNDSTRLRFSIWVIIFNFIMGIVGMIMGSDLTSLGVFLAMSNAPLYVYVLGRSFRAASVPDKYFENPSSGSGGIGGNSNHGGGYYGNDYDRNDWRKYTNSPTVDDYNMPVEQNVNNNGPVKTVNRDPDEIG